MFPIKKFIRSFGFAANGIYQLIRCEQNARVHLLATVTVVIAGCLFGLNRHEWIAVCGAIGIVWAAEAINTAIEKLTDIVSPEKNPKAGLVKDIAAGAVLICAVTAVIIAALVFVPHIKTLSL